MQHCPDQAMHMGTNCAAAFAKKLPTKLSGSQTHATKSGVKLICDPGLLPETLWSLLGKHVSEKSCLQRPRCYSISANQAVYERPMNEVESLCCICDVGVQEFRGCHRYTELLV